MGPGGEVKSKEQQKGKVGERVQDSSIRAKHVSRHWRLSGEQNKDAMQMEEQFKQRNRTKQSKPISMLLSESEKGS